MLRMILDTWITSAPQVTPQVGELLVAIGERWDARRCNPP